MQTPLHIVIAIAAIWIALGLACALWVARRRRTGECQVVGDPFFFPFGDMPSMPIEQHLVDLPDGGFLAFGTGGRSRDASDFRSWGIPNRFAVVMTSANPQRSDENFHRRFFTIETNPSAAVPRRNESDGRRESCPVSSLSSGQGAAVVLTFPQRGEI
jgi:hypothetical protein